MISSTNNGDANLLFCFFQTFLPEDCPKSEQITRVSLDTLLKDRSKPKRINPDSTSLILLPEQLSTLDIMNRVVDHQLDVNELKFFNYIHKNFGYNLSLESTNFLFLLRLKIFSYLDALKIDLDDKILASLLEKQDFISVNLSNKALVKQIKSAFHVGVSQGFVKIFLYFQSGKEEFINEASLVLNKVKNLAIILERLTCDPISQTLVSSVTLATEALNNRDLLLPFWLLPSRMGPNNELFPPALQQLLHSLPNNIAFYRSLVNDHIKLLEKKSKLEQTETEKIEPAENEIGDKIDHNFEEIFNSIVGCIKYHIFPTLKMSMMAEKIENSLLKLGFNNNFRQLLQDIPNNFPVISKHKPEVENLLSNLKNIQDSYDLAVKCLDEAYRVIVENKYFKAFRQTEKDRGSKVITIVTTIIEVNKDLIQQPYLHLKNLYTHLKIVLSTTDEVYLKRVESLNALIPSSIKALYPGQKRIDILAIYLRQVIDDVLIDGIKYGIDFQKNLDNVEYLLLIVFSGIKQMFHFEFDQSNIHNLRSFTLKHFVLMDLSIHECFKTLKKEHINSSIHKNITFLFTVLETFREALSKEILFVPNHPLGTLLTDFGDSHQWFDKSNPLCVMWVKQTLRFLNQTDGCEFGELDEALMKASKSLKSPEEIKSISALRKKISDSGETYLTRRQEIIELLKNNLKTKDVKLIHQVIEKFKNFLSGLVSIEDLQKNFSTIKHVFELLEFVKLRKILISLEFIINQDREGFSLPINQFEMIESERKDKKHPIQSIKKPKEIELFNDETEIEVIPKTTLWTPQLEPALSSLISSSLKTESKKAFQQCIVYATLIDQYRSLQNQPYLNALGFLLYTCLLVEQVSKACIYEFLDETINPSHNLSELIDLVQSIQGIKDCVSSFEDETFLKDIANLNYFISHTSRHYPAPHDENEYQPLIILQKLSNPDEISQQLKEVEDTGARILQLVDEVLSFICTKKQVKVIEKEKYVPVFSYAIELPPYNPSKITNNLPTIRQLKKIRIQLDIIEKTFFNYRSLIIRDTIEEILSVLEKIKSTSSETFNNSPLALSLLLCTKLGELIEHALLFYISLKNPSFWETSYETSTTSRSIGHSHLINKFAENVETLSDSKFTLNEEQKKLLDSLTFILLQFNHYPHKSIQNKPTSSELRLSIVFQALIELTATTGQESQIKDIIDKHIIAMEPIVLDIVSKVFDLLLKK